MKDTMKELEELNNMLLNFVELTDEQRSSLIFFNEEIRKLNN